MEVIDDDHTTTPSAPQTKIFTSPLQIPAGTTTTQPTAVIDALWLDGPIQSETEGDTVEGNHVVVVPGGNDVAAGGGAFSRTAATVRRVQHLTRNMRKQQQQRRGSMTAAAKQQAHSFVSVTQGQQPRDSKISSGGGEDHHNTASPPHQQQRRRSGGESNAVATAASKDEQKIIDDHMDDYFASETTKRNPSTIAVSRSFGGPPPPQQSLAFSSSSFDNNNSDHQLQVSKRASITTATGTLHNNAGTLGSSSSTSHPLDSNMMLTVGAAGVRAMQVVFDQFASSQGQKRCAGNQNTGEDNHHQLQTLNTSQCLEALSCFGLLLDEDQLEDLFAEVKVFTATGGAEGEEAAALSALLTKSMRVTEISVNRPFIFEEEDPHDDDYDEDNDAKQITTSRKRTKKKKKQQRRVNFDEFLQLVVIIQSAARFRLFVPRDEETQRRLDRSRSSTFLLPDSPVMWFWNALILAVTIVAFWLAVVTHTYDNIELPKFFSTTTWMEVMITIMFGVDIVVRFFVASRVEAVDVEEGRGGTTSNTDDDSSHSRWILLDTARAIALAYVKSYFILDVLAMLPLRFVFAFGGSSAEAHVDFTSGTVINGGSLGCQAISCWNQDGLKSAMLWAKILAHLRILKLLGEGRYYKESSIQPITSSYVTLKFGVLPILRLAALVIYVGHVLIVIFLTIERVQGRSRSYINGLYIALMCVSTAGFGDIVPDSFEQRVYFCLLIVIGWLANAYFIGGCVSYFQQSDMHSRKAESLVKLRSVLEYFSVPEGLQLEVFAFQNHVLTTNFHALYTHGLPIELQRDIDIAMRTRTILSVPSFRGIHQGTVLLMCNALLPATCVPEEYLILPGEEGEEMFFLTHGFIDVKAASNVWLATLRPGSYFGELAILSAEPVVWTTSVRALTYCEMLILPRSSFLEIAEKYPRLRGFVEQATQLLLDHEDEMAQQQETCLNACGENNCEVPAPNAAASTGLDQRIRLDFCAVATFQQVQKQYSTSSAGGGAAGAMLGASVMNRSNTRRTAAAATIPNNNDDSAGDLVMMMSHSGGARRRGSVSPSPSVGSHGGGGAAARFQAAVSHHHQGGRSAGASSSSLSTIPDLLQQQLPHATSGTEKNSSLLTSKNNQRVIMMTPRRTPTTTAGVTLFDSDAVLWSPSQQAVEMPSGSSSASAQASLHFQQRKMSLTPPLPLTHRLQPPLSAADPQQQLLTQRLETTTQEEEQQQVGKPRGDHHHVHSDDDDEQPPAANLSATTHPSASSFLPEQLRTVPDGGGGGEEEKVAPSSGWAGEVSDKTTFSGGGGASSRRKQSVGFELPSFSGGGGGGGASGVTPPTTTTTTTEFFHSPSQPSPATPRQPQLQAQHRAQSSSLLSNAISRLQAMSSSTFMEGSSLRPPFHLQHQQHQQYQQSGGMISSSQFSQSLFRRGSNGDENYQPQQQTQQRSSGGFTAGDRSMATFNPLLLGASTSGVGGGSGRHQPLQFRRQTHQSSSSGSSGGLMVIDRWPRLTRCCLGASTSGGGSGRHQPLQFQRQMHQSSSSGSSGGLMSVVHHHGRQKSSSTSGSVGAVVVDATSSSSRGERGAAAHTQQQQQPQQPSRGERGAAAHTQQQQQPQQQPPQQQQNFLLPQQNRRRFRPMTDVPIATVAAVVEGHHHRSSADDFGSPLASPRILSPARSITPTLSLQRQHQRATTTTTTQKIPLFVGAGTITGQFRESPQVNDAKDEDIIRQWTPSTPAATATIIATTTTTTHAAAGGGRHQSVASPTPSARWYDQFDDDSSRRPSRDASAAAAAYDGGAGGGGLIAFSALSSPLFPSPAVRVTASNNHHHNNNIRVNDYRDDEDEDELWMRDVDLLSREELAGVLRHLYAEAQASGEMLEKLLRHPSA
ncbi:cation efflux transmembrane transport protein, putative, partial [Bodo saltans]